MIQVFLGIFFEALPFLLAGALVSSALHLFVPEAQVRRWLPRSSVAAAAAGAVLGMGFPVCECGSVPAARRLISKGAPVPLGIAFVLAAPVVNPIVIASTWAAFNDWRLVAARVGLTAGIAMLVGVLVGLHPAPATLLARHPHHDHDHHHEGWLRALLGHAAGEFFEMGRFLVLGALVAAALQTFIPRESLEALGQGPLTSVLAMLALAVVLSICSTVDAFVALAFAQTFLPGALLGFLVFGPMIDIKSLLMLTTTFRRRVVAIIALLVFQCVLLAALLVNVYGT